MAEHQHGTELNPLSRTVTPRLLRWQAGSAPKVEPEKSPPPELTPEQRREQQRLWRIRRSWYAAYERAEWWRDFRMGCVYGWLMMLGVFAFGLVVGYLAHGVVRHG